MKKIVSLFIFMLMACSTSDTIAGGQRGVLFRRADGNTIRTTDNGKTWHNINKADPVGFVWNRYDNTVYRSNDGGMTWKKKTLPVLPVANITKNPDILWEKTYEGANSYDSSYLNCTVFFERELGGYYLSNISNFGTVDVYVNSSGDLERIHRYIDSVTYLNLSANERESGEIDTWGVVTSSYFYPDNPILYTSTIGIDGSLLKHEYDLKTGYFPRTNGSFVFQLPDNGGYYACGGRGGNYDTSISYVGSVTGFGEDRKVAWETMFIPKNGIKDQSFTDCVKDDGETITLISTIDWAPEDFKTRHLRISRTDLNGNIIFDRRINESSGRLFSKSIFASGDGNYIVIGKKWIKKTGSNEQLPYTWIGKVNELGEVLWSKIYAAGNSWFDLTKARQNPDGTFFVIGDVGDYADVSTGTLNSFDSYLLHLTKDGELINEYIWGLEGQADALNDAQYTKDGNIAVVGFRGGGGERFGSKLYFSEIKNTFSSVKPTQEVTHELLVYPNPSVSGQVTIKSDAHVIDATYEVRDILGRVVMSEKQTGEETMLSTSTLPAGSYLVSVKGSAATPTPLVIH